ncbi:hypothetical protein GA0116948_1283 [Chitinophaga costaii]|uniref:DUF7683 domain-containing protein n=1 Tax=Chitinophaga costaii TaxID=1335309 RepID=A0A1C4G8I0_9BACT|nr:hypothetical protein [Chitinophaga costaii]PUZ19491.1 hypothetical protein DCM91_20550 [Chitinophaga costaii]SCC64223.1 hypothetical protein GA0116948_1283 [Chitinophaga costaii]
MTNLKDKLVRIERTLNIYNKRDELISEIEIDISLNKLLEIVTPNEDDPELYNGYELDSSQLHKINQLNKIKFKINTEEKTYHLVCGGIYNW